MNNKIKNIITLPLNKQQYNIDDNLIPGRV